MDKRCTNGIDIVPNVCIPQSLDVLKKLFFFGLLFKVIIKPKYSEMQPNLKLNSHLEKKKKNKIKW